MYNGKPAIAAALSGDTALTALIPQTSMADGVVSSKDPPPFPYLTYEEIANVEALHADDDEIESEVTFRIHLWGTESLSTLAGHVNRIMHGLGYGRNYSMDQDEQLDSGKTIKHKIMSYTGIFTA